MPLFKVRIRPDLTLTLKLNFKPAIGEGDCAGETVESVTDDKGNFKIVGLTQECAYRIAIHSKAFLISPSHHQIKIGAADATDIEFSAFKGLIVYLFCDRFFKT